MAPQKRSAEEADTLIAGVKAVIVDIEGTTTPITFVKDTLFPYITKNLDTYLEKHFDDAETQKDIAALRTQASKEKEDGASDAVEIPEGEASKEDVIKAVAANVRGQMSKDSKSTELKQIQGHILKEAYSSGDCKGDLFKDVPDVLKQLVEEGIKLYVYSSGSIEAQKLLFSHTNKGDLVHLFSGFFDTTTGSKTESSSYKKILEETGCKDADDVLFLTDNPDEATAAVEAGLRSTLVIRDGNDDLEEEHLQNFSCIENFKELFGEFDFEDDLKRFEGQQVIDDDDDDDDVDDDDDDVVDDDGDVVDDDDPSDKDDEDA